MTKKVFLAEPFGEAPGSVSANEAQMSGLKMSLGLNTLDFIMRRTILALGKREDICTKSSPNSPPSLELS
jgi:hypothetical protein